MFAVRSDLDRLQLWFSKQCDGVWEHRHGIVIQTTDNPGWWVKISLRGTALEGRRFEELRRGELSMDPQPPWLHCYIENDTFNGAGDISTLSEIIMTFMVWADE